VLKLLFLGLGVEFHQDSVFIKLGFDQAFIEFL